MTKNEYEVLYREFELILDNIPALIFFKDLQNNFLIVKNKFEVKIVQNYIPKNKQRNIGKMISLWRDLGSLF